MYTGPNLTNDDLVFGYDTGYGIASNNTATRFCPGQPSVNLFGDISNANARPNRTEYNTSAWTANFPKPPEDVGRVYSHTSGSLNSTWSGNSYGYTLISYSYSANTTYTLSCWVYVSVDCNIGALHQSMEGTTLTNSTNRWYDLNNKGTWQQLSLRCNSSSVVNGNAIIAYPSRSGVTDGSHTGFWAIGGAKLEISDQVTPYVLGSRTSTQSLIDLKRTRNIDVANVSYDSAAQHVYDGSDDYIVSTALLVEGSQTFEAVFTPTANAHSPCAILTNHSYTSPVANFGINYISGNKLGASIGYTDGTREYDSKQTSGAVWVNGSNIAVHAVLAYNATLNQIKWYINGELDATHSLSKTPNFQSIPVCSGRWVYNYGDYYYDGQIHLGKIYKKELTASEIKSNFKAYKNRFNI
jgi:hypothetical protein